MKFADTIKIGLMALLGSVSGWLLLSRTVAPVAAQATPQARELHETYDLAPGGTIAISNISGYIRITSWNENRVKVDAIKRGRQDEDLTQLEMQVAAQPNRLELRTISPRRASNVWVDYDVKVPRTAALNSITSISGEISVTDAVARLTARSNSGSITVREVVGDAFLTTTSGNVKIDRVGGALTINTMSGALTIGEVGSTLNARTTSSNIGVAGVRDDVTAHSISGNIELQRIGGRAAARTHSGSVVINDVGGDVSADTASNNLTMTNVRGRVTATTLSGNVTVRQVNEGVRVTGVSGVVQVSDARGRIEITTTSNPITLTNIDSRDVIARSHSGDVRFAGRLHDDGRYELVSFSSQVLLLVPPDSNFNLTATSHSGSINTEFPLRISPGSSYGGGAGSVSGTVGKGGAQVRAASFSGSVIIKKAVGQTK